VVFIVAFIVGYLNIALPGAAVRYSSGSQQLSPSADFHARRYTVRVPGAGVTPYLVSRTFGVKCIRRGTTSCRLEES